MDFARRDHQAQVVDRVAYVASFADMARRAGDTYLLGYRVTDVSSNDEFATIQLSGESEKRTLTGRALVLASGFGSELAGQLGLGKAGDYVTGVQAEVLAPDIDEIHVYFGQDIAPGFFAWLVPTSGGRVLVGLLSRHHGQLHLEKLLLRLQVEGKVKAITKEAARWGVPLRPPARTFGERVLAIGDAAGQVKPTTGGGMCYALLASEVAADVLHRGFCLNELSASQLSHYEKEWKSLLSQEMKIGYSTRRAFENLDDRQIDFVMHTIAGNGIYKELADSRSVSFDWHSGVIMKLMGQPILGKALSLFNPVLASLASHPQIPLDCIYPRLGPSSISQDPQPHPQVSRSGRHSSALDIVASWMHQIGPPLSLHATRPLW